MKTARKKYQPRRPGPTQPSRKRQYVYLDDDDLRSLRTASVRLQLSRSHTIRLAIRRFCMDVEAEAIEQPNLQSLLLASPQRHS